MKVIHYSKKIFEIFSISLLLIAIVGLTSLPTVALAQKRSITNNPAKVASEADIPPYIFQNAKPVRHDSGHSSQTQPIKPVGEVPAANIIRVGRFQKPVLSSTDVKPNRSLLRQNVRKKVNLQSNHGSSRKLSHPLTDRQRRKR